MKNLLIVLLLIVASCVHKSKQNNISTKDKSFEILAKANSFGFGYKLGQTVRKTDEAYKELINSKNPLEIFKQLFEKGNTQGRLYALCAFYKLDKNIFNDFAKKMDKKETVFTQFGCCVGEQLVEEILLDLHENEFYYQP